jgi:hypothetical protein
MDTAWSRFMLILERKPMGGKWAIVLGLMLAIT